MKEELLDILCCPVCKGDLEVDIRKKKGTEIETGSLHCAQCNVTYPIDEGIPNLLPQT